MTGKELLEVRNWLMVRARETTPADKDITESTVHPLTCVILDMLNEEIKNNFLTVEVPQLSVSLPKESVADLVKKGAKIKIIKLIREIFKWGLKESKDFLDARWEMWTAKVTA
jgi:hypothetical protein